MSEKVSGENELVHYGIRMSQLYEDRKKIFGEILQRFVEYAEIRLDVAGVELPTFCKGLYIICGTVFWSKTGVAIDLRVVRDHLEKSLTPGEESDQVVFFYAYPGNIRTDSLHYKAALEKAEGFTKVFDDFLVELDLGIPLRFFHLRDIPDPSRKNNKISPQSYRKGATE